MTEIGSENIENPYLELADQLDKMQAGENDGRGVSCVQSIVQQLRLGLIENAKHIAFWDGDKIRNYPDIKQVLAEHGMIHDFRLR